MTATAKPELSDDWRVDEPLAYLVKCFNTVNHEYLVFANEADARRFAEDQEQKALNYGKPDDWLVYPLYAGNGRGLSERRFS
jgi:hypothetical protein